MLKQSKQVLSSLPHYECSITEINSDQDCDYYAFTRVKKDFSVGLVSWCHEKE